MNQIEFVRKEEYLDGYMAVSVDIFIDGANLIELIKQVENNFDKQIAGQYSGITPSELLKNLTAESEDLDEHNKRKILECECGSDGCWSFLLNQRIEQNKIIWKNFEQIHRENWQYESIEPLTFGIINFSEQLEKLKNWSKHG